MQAVTHYTRYQCQTGEYSDFGVPATILAHYLRENGIVPEKCDLNSILSDGSGGKPREAGTTGGDAGAIEQHIEDDSPLAEVLPSVYNKYPVRYRDYTLASCVRRCTYLYVSFDVKDLQKATFREQVSRQWRMHRHRRIAANIRGEVELVRIAMPKGELRQKGRCLIHLACFAWYPVSLGRGGSTSFPCTGRRGEFVAGIFAGAARCL